MAFSFFSFFPVSLENASPWSATVLLLLAALTYLALTAVSNVFFHPLSRFPGPKLWAAFRIPYVVSLQSGHLHQRMLEFHDRYGPIVRLAPNELSFTDAGAWKGIYGNRPGHAPFPRNHIWFQKLQPDDPETIMGPEEEAHARFRKVLVHAFSDKALKEQAPIIESHVDLLIERLRPHAPDVDTGAAIAVDLVEWLTYTTFDISGDLSFGESFGCLQNSRAHPWVEISTGFGKGVALTAAFNLYPPLNKMLQYILPAKVWESVMDHRRMSQEKVQRRLDFPVDRPDFLGAITKQRDEKGQDVMTIKEMYLNMAIVVFAGSETTASGLAGTLRMLMQNPDPMEKLVREIRGTFDNETHITTATVGRLEYLTAVINEGLRLCPPSTIGVPRLVPPRGDTVCGEWLPGGTYVTVNQHPTFRSGQNFTRAGEFIPERFLRSSPSPSGSGSGSGSEFAGDNMAAFFPFSMGRHSCIGQNLAYTEMRLILAKLLYVFDMRLADATDVWDWGRQKTFIFWEKEPLMAHLEEVVRR